MLHAGAEISEAANQLEETGSTIGARCLGVHFEGPFLNPKFRRVHRGDWIVPADARARARDDRGLPRRARHGDDGARDGRRRRMTRALLRSGYRLLGRPHLGAIPRGRAGDRLGLPHADARVQRDAAARSPRPLAAGRVHARGTRTTVQLICDGYHVSPPMVDLLYRTLGERLVLRPTTCRRPEATTASRAASCARRTARSPAARCTSIKRCAT